MCIRDSAGTGSTKEPSECPAQPDGKGTGNMAPGLRGQRCEMCIRDRVGPVLQAMGDVEQSGGCALFVAAMAAGHAPRLKQDVYKRQGQ